MNSRHNSALLSCRQIQILHFFSKKFFTFKFLIETLVIAFSMINVLLQTLHFDKTKLSFLSSSMLMQHHLDISYLKTQPTEILFYLFYQDLRATNENMKFWQNTWNSSIDLK